eukprot:COSAG03_NODE_574_length_6896_cov_8.214948_3_plen_122_part_00
MTPQTTANHEIMRTQLTLVGAALLGTGAHAQVQCDYLGSDVQATSAQVGWESYHVDFTPAERGDGTSGILLDGVQYRKGIFAHAPSNVVFSLDGAYQTARSKHGHHQLRTETRSGHRPREC